MHDSQFNMPNVYPALDCTRTTSPAKMQSNLLQTISNNTFAAAALERYTLVDSRI
jgi:hypothetical protein